MTETTTQPLYETPDQQDDILLTLIVALLAPMFLTASGSDINLARLAALQAVDAYRARSQIDLIAIAQVIGCGLIALGSLGLSMADDLSLSMVLRLRGNAVSLNRVADQNRRALAAPRTAAPKPIPPPDPAYEATVQIDLAAAQKLTAEAMANLRKPEPTPATAAPPAAPAQPEAKPEAKPVRIATPPTPPTAHSPISHREWQVKLASAMTDIAAEFTTDVTSLPPEQRAAASHRAALLSSAATEVILGNIPPLPDPGDLIAFMQQNANGK